MIEYYLKCHFVAFAIGYILDLIIGDPMNFPHPVRLIGKLISFLDNHLRLTIDDVNIEEKSTASGAADEKINEIKRKNRLRGVLLVVIVSFAAAFAATGVIGISYYVDWKLGIVVEAVLTYYVLATKSLKKESMKVSDALKSSGLDSARKSLSMIVGRDTEKLDEPSVIRAAVETVAENASDGVTAPMLWAALLGPFGAYLYKAINTMDSMVGYKNDKYIDFGRCAAKTDDVVNFIPSRISAFLMIFSCFICERFDRKHYDHKNAKRIFKRDRFNHKSPNSAQTESMCAGALSVRLAGPASYFGKIVEKPYIGDDIRPIEVDDIARANKLMYGSSITGFLLCELLGWIIICMVEIYIQTM